MPTPALALILIALGVLCRLGPFLSNYRYLGVPMAGLALYAAARLPRRWALAVPLATLLLSDLYIDPNHAYPFEYATRLATYVFFGLLAVAGAAVPSRA